MTDYESGYDARYGYNKNAFAPETKTIGTTVMGLVMKGITTPIGLVSEAVHTSSNSKKHKGTEAGSKLPFPVIVPQRRPGQKNRGFIRAYAPVLEDVGIDQAMFLSFIANLQKAAQASPILDVLVVATSLAAFYPEPTIGLGLQAAQVALAIAQEMQERWKTNKFLEQANRDVFIPRGLFAMLVTYKPVPSGAEPDVTTKTIDLGAQAVAKYGDRLMPDAAADNSGGEKRIMAGVKDKVQQRLRVSSGKVEGDAQMPVMCAPLIFPAIEEQAMKTKRDGENETLAKWQNKSKDASIWMGDYFDRRAQASFAFRNPDSKLAANSTPVNFKSRFADPNNHMNLHFFTLITGGLYKAEPLGAKRRWEEAKKKEAAKRAQGQKVKGSKRALGEDFYIFKS